MNSVGTVANHTSALIGLLSIPMQTSDMLFVFGNFVSHAFGFVSKAGKSLKSRDWKLIDHGAKAVNKLGACITRIGTLLAEVKGFLPPVSSMAVPLRIAIPALVAVGVALSGACLFNDVRNAYKIRQFQKQFRAVQRNWEAGVQQQSFRAKDAAFRELIHLIETTRPGILRKSLGVKKEALHDLVKTMYRKTHREAEITNFFQKIDKRTSQQMRLQLINVAFDVAGLVSSSLLLIPVLQPVGFVFMALSLGGAVYNIGFQIHQGYKFEEEIGLINSRYSKPQQLSMKDYALQKLGIRSMPEEKAEIEKPVQKRVHPQPALASRKTYKRVRYA